MKIHIEADANENTGFSGNQNKEQKNNSELRKKIK